MHLTLLALIPFISTPLAPRFQDARPQPSAPAPDHLHHAPGTATAKAAIAHVERRGHGPVPVVLLAGAPFGWRAWENFMTRNAERYTMIAITPAGYDGTPPLAMPAPEHEDYGERAWTEALLTEIDALVRKEFIGEKKLGAAVVVGHHLMSDYYAVRLAAEHPELVRAVVSVAGLGSAPVGRGSTTRADRLAFVREKRAPFFRAVSQETWNANTFSASALSNDATRGKSLFEAEIAVPLATQIRYYLEYMTDDLESAIAKVGCPILSLQLRVGGSLDSLSDEVKKMLVQRFGSLEEAAKQVQFGGPWDSLAALAKPGVLQVQQLGGGAAFAMDDEPEAFDRQLAEFIDGLPKPAATAGKTKKP
ncbi:MAG: alpha/beta hydrolase [Planctomycetes bacterium]|nr:alpha/beta hydrolase [Planctomycetota bacterium]